MRCQRAIGHYSLYMHTTVNHGLASLVNPARILADYQQQVIVFYEEEEVRNKIISIIFKYKLVY